MASNAGTIIAAGGEIASIVASGVTWLPLCGPVCSIIESTLETIRTKGEVQRACGTDIPRDLDKMKVILKAIGDQLPAASCSERRLFDGYIEDIRLNLVKIESVITSFAAKNGVVQTLTSKKTKAKLEGLHEELGKAKETLHLLLVIFPRDSKVGHETLGLLQTIAGTLVANATARPGDKIEDEREMAKLQKDYAEINKLMQVLKGFRSRLGEEHWATAIILPGSSSAVVTEEERKKIFEIMKESEIFWRGIQKLHKRGVNVFEDDTNWVQRGRSYRALVEPLDIVNWYFTEKNTRPGKGHYVDDIEYEDELFDNNKRPGRYILLQTVEGLHTGKQHVVSSLGTARTLKTLLGETSWKQFKPNP
ncbi:unnamed protein product [Scytosiphon promiscuus]